MERNRSDEIIFNARRPSGAAVMQSDVTVALTRAFFKEWARVGYAALSLERVAKNAGAGKAALYRRWSSKVAMASDLLSKVGLTLFELPDTGSLEADLLAFLFSLRRVLRHRIIQRVTLDLLAEIGREPALEGRHPAFPGSQAKARENSDRSRNRARRGAGDDRPRDNRRLHGLGALLASCRHRRAVRSSASRDARPDDGGGDLRGLI